MELGKERRDRKVIAKKGREKEKEEKEKEEQ